MELRVFCLRELTPSLREETLAAMTEARRARALRLRSDDRDRTIAGELLMRRLAGELCGLPAAAVQLRTETGGRPFAVRSDTGERLPICISIAHAGEYAVCAADRRPIGIDLEPLRVVRPETERRVCTKEERRWLSGASDETERRRRFLMLWTLREAYGKATGRGVFRELGGVSFRITGGDVTADVPGWRFSLLGDIPGYMLALCESAAGAER